MSISRQHVDLLRRTENIRVFAAMQRDQQLFIRFAADLEWKSFKNTVKYWLMVNDQDGPDPEDHEAENSCTLTEMSNGRVRLTLDLDPKSGGILKQQLQDEENSLFDKDQEDGTVRTASQRRAAAAANLIERGASRSEAKAKPLIHVVMSLKVLMHAIAQLAKEPHEQDFVSALDANDVDGRCELLDGTPVHPKYALVLSMQARIRRQVLTAKSNTIDASSPTRLFPQWMKASVSSKPEANAKPQAAMHLHPGYRPTTTPRTPKRVKPRWPTSEASAAQTTSPKAMGLRSPHAQSRNRQASAVVSSGAGNRTSVCVDLSHDRRQGFAGRPSRILRRRGDGD